MGNLDGPTDDPRDFRTVPIHRYPELIDQTVDLINSEWPRSRTARLWSLEGSRDDLPTSLVATKCANQVVIAHCKLTPIPSDPDWVFVESVVVAKEERGKGIGRYIMRQAEDYCRSQLGVKGIYLSTRGQEPFYRKLGYDYCEPINVFGTRKTANTVTKKTYMQKSFS